MAKEFLYLLHYTAQDREVICIEFAVIDSPLDFAHHGHVVIERRIVTHALEYQAIRLFVAAQIVFSELPVCHQPMEHNVEEKSMVRRHDELDTAEICATGAECIQFLLHLAPDYAIELLGEGDDVIVIQRGHRVIDIDVFDIFVRVVPF